MPPVFTSEYYSDFHGAVKYREYNPMRYDYQAFSEVEKIKQEECILNALELFGDLVEVV